VVHLLETVSVTVALLLMSEKIVHARVAQCLVF